MPTPFRYPMALAVLLLACACLLPTAAAGQSAPGQARIVGGKAVPPPDAPATVRRVIAAANRIATKPYRYGGGHARFEDSGYDCSGAVSYALRGGGLIDAPRPSGGLMSWGKRGTGRWITVYAHGGHAYLMVAGLRFDTGYRDRRAARQGVKPGDGPRWGYARSTKGFVARRPASG